MNRTLQQFTSSLNRGLVLLEGQAQLNGAGAVTNASGAGILSVTRVSTGLYRIVFGVNYTNNGVTSIIYDTYFQYLFGSLSFLSGLGLSGLSDLTWSFTPAVSIVTGTNPIPHVDVTFVNDTGVVTDPATGLIINFFFMLKNSAAQP